MPYLTIARGFLRHLPKSAEPTLVCQPISFQSARAPTSFSLQAISVAGDGGGGAQGGEVRQRIPREGGRGGIRPEGGAMDRGDTTGVGDARAENGGIR